MATFLPTDLSKPPVVAQRFPASGVEIAILGFLMIAALYLGQVVLVPLALAVILSFVLAPPVRLLRRLGIANAPAVFVVVGLAFTAIFGVGALITQQVGSLAAELPRYQLILKDKVKMIKSAAEGSGGAIERASETLKDLQNELEKPDRNSGTIELPSDAASSNRPIPVEVHAPQPTSLDQLQSIIGVILAPLATAGLVVLFVIFLLLQREDVRDRAIRLLGSNDFEKSTTAMDDAGHRLSQYFLTLTVINTAYGVVIGCVLWAIGIPSPILWGALAMLMRFVPFIGSFVAAAFPVLLAAAVDQGWSMVLMTLALYVVGEIIMGNIIEPVVQGQRTGLSPLAIVLSAAFWTLLWGPIGLLLAIPLTVVLVVLGRHVDSLEFLHVLLGDTPPLSPEERFYQRMLAGDPAEAVEQAEKIIKTSSLIDYYDDVAVPALQLGQADVDRGTLETSRLEEIRDTAEVVIDTLSDHNLQPPETDKPRAGEKDDDEEGEEAPPPLVIPDELPDAWHHPNAVLCIASRTALDETAAMMLTQLLEKCGFGARTVSAEHVRHGALKEQDLEGVRVICISSLDAHERSAHARFLVRRLKRYAPDARLVGCFWTLDPEGDQDKTIAETIAVDTHAGSLREAVADCLETAMSAGGPIDDKGEDGPAYAASA